MGKRILKLLTISPEIQLEFRQDSFNRNQISLLVISIMIFGMELFNIFRVLFWSDSGLRSVNNRIYFGMYCTLLFGASLFLLLQYLLRGASLRIQWTVQLTSIAFFFLWHIGLNTYDLARDSAAGVYPFITAIMGIAMFIQMPQVLSIAYFGLGYALFMILNVSALDHGTAINLTITTIVALAISLTRSHHVVVDLCQRREIKRMNVKLQQLLQKDPFTGLFNKKASQDCIACSLEAARKGEHLVLYMVDLDDFKLINDQYGHPCGDHVLQETARALQAAFPGAICIGRIGGDEFTVLLHGIMDVEALERRGDHLIEALSEIHWKGQRLGVTCSIGILRVEQSNVSYEQVYGELDRALYDAKRHGKGSCCFREMPRDNSEALRPQAMEPNLFLHREDAANE